MRSNGPARVKGFKSLFILGEERKKEQRACIVSAVVGASGNANQSAAQGSAWLSYVKKG